jgi:hypothetical protein
MFDKVKLLKEIIIFLLMGKIFIGLFIGKYMGKRTRKSLLDVKPGMKYTFCVFGPAKLKELEGPERDLRAGQSGIDYIIVGSENHSEERFSIWRTAPPIPADADSTIRLRARKRLFPEPDKKLWVSEYQAGVGRIVLYNRGNEVYRNFITPNGPTTFQIISARKPN